MHLNFTLKPFAHASYLIFGLTCFLIFGNQSAQAAAVTVTVTQASTTTVAQGATNREILRIDVMNGGGNPTNTATSMQFNTLNTSNADVSTAKLYYTGTTATFNPAAPGTLLGSTSTIGATLSFTFSQAISGTNTHGYFWLVYDVSATATPCNTLDATVSANNIVVAGLTYNAALQSPTGSRQITGIPSVSIAASPSGAICAGTSVTFTATPVNGGSPTYQWQVNSVNAGTNSSTFTTTSLTNGAQVKVIMTSSIGCITSPATATATSNIITAVVNPLPVLTATPASQTFCSGGQTSIALSSSISSSTFSWTVAVSGSVTGAAAGNGSTIAQTLVNTGNTPATVTYTAKAISPSGCNSANVNIVVTVNPSPVVTATPSSQILCSGSATNVSLSSSVASSTFAWTTSSTGSVSGQSNGNGSTVAQTLTNTGTTDATVTYSVIATSPNGCSGAATTVVETVHPKPIATVTPASQTFCSGNATSLALTSNVTGTSFAWTSVATSPLLTGNSNATGSGIADLLTNTDVVPRSVTYTITPTASGCSGNAVSATVTVNPVLPASVSIIANPAGTLCAGTNVAFTASPVNGGSSPSYQWKINGNNVGTNNPTFSTNALQNNDLVSVVMTSNYACPSGNPATSNVITAAVNPVPVVTASPLTDTVCNGNATMIVLTSTVPNTTFNWTASAAAGISGQSNGTGDTITQTLTNGAIAAGDVIYTVTPTANGCSGSPVTVTINVDPAVVIATVTATPSNEICEGTTVAFNASVSNGGANPNYQWQLNGTDIVGATNATYSSNGLVDNDTVLVLVTSSAACTNGTLVYSNETVMTVHANPAAPVASLNTPVCAGESVNFNADAFAAGTYNWSGPNGFTSGQQNPTLSNTTVAASGNYSVTYTDAFGCASPSTQVSLIVNPLPAANAGTNTGICNNGSSTAIGAAAVIGNSYSWSSTPSGFASNNASETVAPVVNTTYALVETIDATGCSATNNVVVTVNPLPNDNAGNDATICSGTSSTIGAASIAGHVYQWTSSPNGFSSSVSNPSVSPVVTTTYFLTETISSTGCSDTNAVIINVNPTPAANAGSNVAICNGGSIAIGSASTAGNSYSWSSSPAGFSSTLSNPVVSPTVTTTYTLTETIDATGCNKSNAVVVTVNPLPVDHAGADAAICSGSSTTIGAASTAGRTYSWTSSPAGFTSAVANPSVSPTVTTTYALVETITATGCSATNTVIVTVNPLPAASVASNASVCNGSSVSIGAANVAGTTYAWTSAPAGFSSTVSNPSVAPTVTTTYTLTQTITATGCSKSNSVVITVNPLPAAAVGNNAAICNGTSATIGATAVAGNTYSWTSNPSGLASSSASVLVSPTVTTTYTLVETVTATGCSKSNSVVITVNPLPAATAGTSSAICNGSSKQLGATSTAGHTYSWTSNPAGFTSSVANPTVSPTVTTTYALVETITATGCSAANNVVVTVNPLPAATAGTNGAICNNGASVSLGAASITGSTYSWTSNPAGFTSTISNPIASPTVTTTYALTQTITATGCSKTNSVVITVNPLPAANAGTSSSICLGGSKVLGATAVAGSTYSWTSSPAGFASSSANPTVSPTVTTTYTLTQTITATGCNKSNSVVVTVNPVPAAVVGSPATICYGSSVALGGTAVAGNTYNWTPASSLTSSTVSNPTASPVATTAYTLTETITATGCTKSNSVTITVQPQIEILPYSNTPICQGDTAKLYSSANYPLPQQANNNNFTILAGTSNAVMSPMVVSGHPGSVINASTTISVMLDMTHYSPNLLKIYLIAPNGSQVEILDGMLPTPLPSTPVTFNNSTISANATGSLNFSTPPYNNTFGSFQDMSNLNGPLDGTWYLRIEQPTGINGSNSILNGWKLTNGANNGFTYNWSSAPAGFTSSLANPIAFPSATTTYTVTVTNSNTGCTASANTVVTVNAAPAAPTVSSTTACSGQTATVNVTAPSNATFSWYTAATGGAALATGASFTTPALTVPASYFVQTQNSTTGCKSLTRTQANVSINPLPNALVADTQDVCVGVSVNIGGAAVAGNTYNWTSNPTGFTSNVSNPTVAPNDTTVYTLTETITATGCAKSNSTVVFTKEIGTWIGIASTDWDNTVNWCGAIPTPTTNVTITSGCPFYPVIVNGVNATCFNIVMTPGGTVDLTGGTLSVYGHFHPVAPANYTQTGGTLAFTGTLPQQIKTATVKDIVVNNGSGVDLLGNVTVTGVLQLQNGLVNTNAYEVNVTNPALAAISNYAIARYINGNLRRSMDTVGLYDFPVGTATKYELAQLNLYNLHGVSNVLAKFNNTLTGAAPNLTVNGTLINTLLNGGFWTLTPNQQPTSGTYDIILNERGHTNPALSQQAYTVLKRPNATTVWGFEGTTVGMTQSASGGTVTVPNFGLASFSDFAIGFGNTVLPVELTVFNGWNNGDVNDLVWQTESESNSMQFVLERSADGQSFTKIATLAAAGYSLETLNYQYTDAAPLAGNNYYRLKMVDRDMTFDYSNVIVISTKAVATGLHVYPNPASNVVRINIGETLKGGGRAEVLDAMGRLVFEQSIDDRTTTASLRVDQLKAGLYMLRVTDASNRSVQTAFVKQ